MLKKCGDSIKYVVTLANIQSANEASHHLNLTDSCHTFYSHIFVFVQGSLGQLVCCCSLISSQTSSSSSLPVICQFYEPERKGISSCDPCNYCHTLRKKREIKTVSVLTRLPGVPLRQPELVKWLRQGKCFWCRLLGCTQK